MNIIYKIDYILNSEKFLKIKKKFIFLYKLIILFTLSLVLFFIIRAIIDENYGKIAQKADEIDTIQLSYYEEDYNVKEVSLPHTIYTINPFKVYIDLRKYKNLENQKIVVFTRFAEIYCYLDNRLIYQYNIPDMSIPRSGGHLYHKINLPSNYDDDFLELIFYPKSKNANKFNLHSFYVSTGNNFIYNLLSLEGITFLIVITLNIVAVMVILFAYIIKKINIEDKNIFEIGLLCVVNGMFYTTQLEIVNYLYRQFHLAIYFLDFFIFAHYALPVVILLKNKLNPKFNKILGLMVYISGINFSIQLFLTILGISEFHNMIEFTNIVLLISCIVSILAIILSPQEKYPQRNKMALLVAPILLSLISSFWQYWTKGYKTISTFLIINLVVFLIIQVYFAIKDIMSMKKENVNTKTYERLMLTDTLTKLRNRYAFERKIKDIKTNKQNATIVSIDLNNLKYINDNYGHSYGDNAIAKLADMLKNAFPDFIVYRVSGDEFIMISTCCEIDDSQLEKLRNKNNKIDGSNQSIIITFAFGKAFYEYAESKSVEDVIKIADKNMYADKKNFKKVD